MVLTDYWRILRAHWVGVLVLVASMVALAGAYTLTQPKVYAADASGYVSVAGSRDNPTVGSINDSLAKSKAPSYVKIATSRQVAQSVIEQLGLDTTPAALVGRISVEHPLDTVLIDITARASSPESAQQLADAWVRALAEEVRDIEGEGGVGATGVPFVIPQESAALPTAPVSPNPPRNLALGSVLGLILGLGYALVRHSSDRRLRTKEGIEARFDVSVVGSIPSAVILDRKVGARGDIAVESHGATPDRAAASEAFRKLRTNLMYMNVDNPPRVVIVTSPLPGDGKSTLAANLAGAIAASGEAVVLVDGDMRRPTVASSFGLVERVGLSDVLAGRIALDDALQEVHGHESLRVLGAGSTPPNPSELLGSTSMLHLLQKLAAGALVVVDAPPLLPVTDAAVLATRADGAFVVVSAGRTTDDQLGQALDHLDAVDAKTLGVVLNRIARRDSDQYGGYYGYAPPGTAGKRRAQRSKK